MLRVEYVRSLRLANLSLEDDVYPCRAFSSAGYQKDASLRSGAAACLFGLIRIPILRYAYNVRLGAGLRMSFNVALRARAFAIRPPARMQCASAEQCEVDELAILGQLAELGFVSHALHIYTYVALCDVGATMMPVEAFATSRSVCPQADHLR